MYCCFTNVHLALQSTVLVYIYVQNIYLFSKELIFSESYYVPAHLLTRE